MLSKFVPFQHPNTHHGFALMEVLISVLVLAASMIGAAMLQLHAFRTTGETNLHNTALTLAMQIADEMRANHEQSRLSAGSGANSNPFLNLRYKSGGPIPTLSQNCFKSSCTHRELAVLSTVEWTTRVHDTLPGGRLEICRDGTVLDGSGDNQWCAGAASSTNNMPVTIKIGWLEKEDPSGKIVSNNAPKIALLVSPYTQ